MASIAFAAPGIDRFHWHERLTRELRQDGHAVTAVCVDPVEHTFWRHQSIDSTLVRLGPPDPMRAPIDELALRASQRQLPARSHRQQRRRLLHHRQRLASLLPGLLRWFEAERPDLLLLHQRRSGAHALLHYVARETGTRVLWTGDGLLPHTLQVDEAGLDGDAAATRRRAGDYRVVQNEPSLLAACLTNTLARTGPSALTRREVRRPPLTARIADLLAASRWHGCGGPGHALFGWRRALAPAAGAEPMAFELPGTPFVTLLLQDTDDERVRLDADAPPTHRELIVAAAAAAADVDRQLVLVIVVPPRGIDHRELIGLASPVRLHFVRPDAAADAACTGVATLTVNHPLAAVALLAGTPVVHVGRALYGLHGVTTQAITAELAPALARALAKDPATLRQRFLSWLFGYGHIWCSSTWPDHNGLAGLVQAVGTRLSSRHAMGLRMRYRPGPAWPLAADGRGD
ncbi:MAG: hypothetical protein JNM25_02810 [Planctomycetes bacterium]|nr:hypothetical protein [Planctomycetota bacterium]